MGQIYRALDLQTGNLVALKVLHEHATEQYVQRLFLEAQTLSELHHPGIVTHVAHGIGDQGSPYLAMDWLDGYDLSARIRQKKLSADELFVLLHRVSSALAVAHRAHVLHRDIKPANLFLRNGTLDGITLIDFGLSHHMYGGQGLTETGAAIGTPEYMSPEQVRGDRDIGPCSDIFSLGCVAYECLTGTPPFMHEHVAAVLAKILFEDLPALRFTLPQVPAALCELLERMLQKDVTQRIASAVDLLADLDSLTDWRSGMPVLAKEAQATALPPRSEEQLFVSLVMAQPRTDLPASAPTPDIERRLQLLTELALPVKRMIDGSLIAHFSKQGEPTEQVTQAVRCALLIARHCPDCWVAVASGQAELSLGEVVGSIVSRATTLITAARKLPSLPVQPAALIDGTTARLAEEFFSISPCSPALRVVSLRTELQPDQSRTLLGSPTPCVGRERELQLLESMIVDCHESGMASALLVIAPPGLGKSRLRHEFVRRVQSTRPEVLIFSGRGDPMSAGVSYGLITQALRGFFGLQDSDDAAVSQKKIQSTLGLHAPTDNLQELLPFLGELCKVPFPQSPMIQSARHDPSVMSDLMEQAFVKLLQILTQRHSVLFLLEDMHWSDSLTCHLTDTALRELCQQPLMIVALGRPEVEERFPKLWSDRARQLLRLLPLSKKASELLVHQVLGHRLAASTVSRIIDKAAGNTLFLEELLRATLDGKGEELPETIWAILQARMMKLPAEQRRVLRAASVLGDTFWPSGVWQVCGRERTLAQTIDSLARLQEVEILERHRQSRLSSEAEFRFRHDLLRQAAYESFTPEARKTAHHDAARYLESVGGQDPAVLGEHYQRAGELPRAAAHYLRAAERAYDEGNLDQVLHCASHGLECTSDTALRGSFLAMQSASWFWRNELVSALPAAMNAQLMLPQGSHHWLCALSTGITCAAALGRIRIVSDLAVLSASVPIADPLRSPFLKTLSVVIVTLSSMGERQLAQDLLSRQQHMSLAADAGDLFSQAWLHYAQARFDSQLSARVEASIYDHQTAIDAFVRMGNRRMAAIAHSDLGFQLGRVGQFAEAERWFREGLQAATQLDESLTLMWIQVQFALVLAERDHPQAHRDAESMAQRVLASASNLTIYAGLAHAVMSSLHLRTHRHAQAEESARKSLDALRPQKSSAAIGFIALSRALDAAGKTEAALTVVREGIALLDSLDGPSGSELPLRFLLVDLLQQQGDPLAARAAQQVLERHIQLRLANISQPAVRTAFLQRHRPLRKLLF
jgi:tetratricopeptide (TPR) repeat protein